MTLSLVTVSGFLEAEGAWDKEKVSGPTWCGQSCLPRSSGLNLLQQQGEVTVHLGRTKPGGRAGPGALAVPLSLVTCGEIWEE